MSATLVKAVASKSKQTVVHKNEDIEESLDNLDKLVDRLKVLYEQYFMGIQKVAPSHLHTDAERRIRDIAQMSIRNTALRYRFATLQQKFGSYNTYWKRTLRQIEQGRYIRDLSRLQRHAEANGDEVPEEILAKMPKLMRQRVLRDRERAKAKAEREGLLPGGDAGASGSESSAGAVAAEPARAASQRPRDGVHKLDAGLLDGVDFDDLFSSIMDDAVAAVDSLAPPKAAAAPPPRPAPPPAAARPTTPPRPSASATPPPVPVRPPVPAAAARPAPPATVSAASPPRPQPATPPGGARSLPPGMNEVETRKLYDKFVSARKMVGDQSSVSYDALVRTINNQAPRIMTEHKAKGVQFDVVVKGDKVILKAKPQR